MHPMQQIMFE